MRRALATGTALTLSAALVAVATLTPSGVSGVSDSARLGDLFCLSCRPYLLADAVANIVLFVPFGAALMAWQRSVRRAVLVALLASLAVETAQFTGLMAGRHPSALDVVANGMGAAIGAMAFAHWRAMQSPGPRLAARLAIGWACVALLLMSAVSWALMRPVHPARPEVVPTRSTLPFTTGFGWFEREVVDGDVDGTMLTHDGSGALIVAARARDAHVVAVRVRGLDRRDGLVPVLFLHEPGDTLPHLVVAQAGGDVALRVRLNADAVGLRLPDLRAPIEFGGQRVNVATLAAADTMTRVVSGRVAPDAWSLSIVHDGKPEDTVIERLALSPSIGWMLAAPISRFNGPWQAAGTVLFLVLLCGPVVYWSTRQLLTGDAPFSAALASALLLCALVVPPLASGLAPLSRGDWLMVLATAMLSSMLAHWQSRRERERPPRSSGP